MSTHDPISDLITRIRNAQMRAKSKVSTPGSKMRANVLEVLKSKATSAATPASSMLRPQRAEIELNISTASRSFARSSGCRSRAVGFTPR
jgi:Ribosomal protein S8